jgi:hypothetical protein
MAVNLKTALLAVTAAAALLGAAIVGVPSTSDTPISRVHTRAPAK